MEAITNSYKIACCQVIKTIENMSDDQVSKIPPEVIEYYKNNMAENYFFEIDKAYSLKDQKYSKEAAVILTAISKKYLLDEDENKKIDSLLKENSIKIENQKRNLYNPNEVFETENTLKIENMDTQMIEYKETILKKIIKFFKKILKK